MTAPLQRPVTRDLLFLWIMERFAEQFHDHAILKGDLAMRLFDSLRSTTDIDYVFVPYSSKRDVRAGIEAVLAELTEARVELSMHSKMLRAEIHLDGASIQLEASVANECPSIPMSTGGFAQGEGRAPVVVRIMSPACALAHKLAAWNERRLLRDLYDCYFFVARLGESPDREVLSARLSDVHSRIPSLKGARSMTARELASALREAAGEITEVSLKQGLGGLLPEVEFAGLGPRLHAAIIKLAEGLE